MSLDDVIQMYERDPMNAVIIRLGAMAGSVQAVVDSLDMYDYDIAPEELEQYVGLMRQQVTKTDEMFELWAILGATAKAEEEGGE